jgi:hypothetical protein
LGDITAWEAYRWPAVLLAAMLLIAAGISLITGVDGSGIFLPYLATWASLTLIAALVGIFVEVAKLAPRRADRPLKTALAIVARRERVFLLPALIFPIFLGGYTWAKTSIPFLVGYPLEEFWADIDRLVLGSDAWQIAHNLSDPTTGPLWTFFYAVIWGLGLAFTGPLVVACASHRFAATFFTALMLSWTIGGVGLAYALSAAGPVFAHLADPTLATRFAPLHTELLSTLGQDNIILRSQRILAAGMEFKSGIKGGGVSAMPSMHIATATIFLMAARKTLWLMPAAIFLALTFFGSIYTGYHYAVDAVVAAAVAVICWAIAEKLVNPSVIVDQRPSVSTAVALADCRTGG